MPHAAYTELSLDSYNHIQGTMQAILCITCHMVCAMPFVAHDASDVFCSDQNRPELCSVCSVAVMHFPVMPNRYFDLAVDDVAVLFLSSCFEPRVLESSIRPCQILCNSPRQVRISIYTPFRCKVWSDYLDYRLKLPVNH